MAWFNWFWPRSFQRVDIQRTEPKLTPAPKGKAALAAVVGTAAAGLIAVVAQWEGKRNDPYQDIVGVWTVCYGETNTEMRRYTDAECEEMLAESLVDYAKPVLARNPELKGHDPQTLAAVSLTYNIGPGPSDLSRCGQPGVRGGYRCSSIARNFSAGRWVSACNAFLLYNRAGGKPVPGLTNRRNAERKICLRNIPLEYRK